MEVLEIKDYTKEIDAYLKQLFPIARSITGDGNRETLKYLQDIVPLEIKEVPSGQKVYDWTIPQEWTINDAWIKNSKGEKVIDFKKSNLHVVGYSMPINKKMKFSDLKNHLHYREDFSEAIPYRTSYYDKNWGFCLSFNDLNKFFDDEETYEVFIDSQLEDGSLSYGELLIKGKSDKEILISAYICHPSMANDSLSGVLLTAFLAKELKQLDLKYSYRIVFVPETIGAIAYCAENEEQIKKIDVGLVVTTVGGPGQFGYKQSWQKECLINEVVESVFKDNLIDFTTYPFDPHGSDERQYSSPGFRVNTVTISKDKYYEYKQYHTSMDNLDFVKAEHIQESLSLYLQLIGKIEQLDNFDSVELERSDKGEIYYESLYPHCEVMLSKHDLYPKTGGGLLPVNGELNELDAILWILFYCDGKTSLDWMSEKLNTTVSYLKNIADKLEEKKILRRISE